MKQSENLSQLSNEQLMKAFKKAKAIYIAFIIIFLLLLTSCLYITVTKGFGVFTVLPIAFIPLVIANIFSYGKVKEEAKSRNLY